MKRSKDEIIRYARSRLGDIGYHIALNNCQHFATKCRNDVEESFEVMSLYFHLNEIFNEVFFSN